jgi:hypothetical protein
MIEKLATDSDHNYIKENQFQKNLFLQLIVKFPVVLTDNPYS